MKNGSMAAPPAKDSKLETLLPGKLSADLRDAERTLLSAASNGELAMCGPSYDDKDNDPAKAGRWNKKREIRADLIRWLCTSKEALKQIDPRGVSAYGAKIVGDLDLSFVSVPFPLRLAKCFFVNDCDLTQIKVPALSLDGSFIKSLKAYDAEVTGNMLLGSGFSAQKGVYMSQAHIGGSLDCDGGNFLDPDGVALDCDGIDVKGSIFLRKVVMQGKANLILARIGSNLECDEGSFNNVGDVALYGDGIDVKGSIFLRKSVIKGEVNLLYAHIGNNLDCNEGIFSHPEGFALNSDGIDVKGSVFLRNSIIQGKVTLGLAHIGSNLECDGGRFEKADGVVLDTYGADIKGSIFFRENFSAQGKLSLNLAQVGGDLDCEHGSFEELELYDATIKHTFGWHGIKKITSLDLRNANVGRIWDDDQSWPKDINNSPIDGFVYESYYIDGFVYDNVVRTPLGASMQPNPLDASVQLKWIEHQGEFTPQPYQQLAKVLRERADEEGAKRVLLALEKRTRQQSRRNLGRQPVRWLQAAEDVVSDATVGYGIYPERAIWWLAGLTILGWVVHRRAQIAALMAPTEKEAYAQFRDGKIPPNYPPFNPLIYSLENCLPLVKFGQDDKWQPDPHPQAPTAALPGWRGKLKRHVVDRIISPSGLRWCRWVMIGLGWVLATFFVGSLTGIIKSK